MTHVQKTLVNMGVMLLVAAGIALYAWFGVFKKEAAEQEKKDTEAKVFAFKKEDVKKVTLVAKGDTVTMEKDGENWRIVSPVVARAEKYPVDGIVDKMESLKIKETIADDRAKAAEYGLDKPRYQVKLVLADGKELALDVGEESPFDQSLFFGKGGDPKVYLADSGLRWPLDKSLFDLRDKALVTHEDKDVQALEIMSPALAWSVERDGENWKLTVPMQDRADKQTVENVLSKLRSARAKSFVAETPAAADLKQWGLDKPVAMAVFAVGADKAKKALHLGRIDEAGTKKVFARLADGPVMEVEATLVDDLGKTLADLRDKTVASFDREAVRRMEFAPEGAEKFEVTRKKETPPDGGFAAEEFALVGKTEKLKVWKLSSALYTLSSLKGVSIANENATDLAPYGLDKPKATYAVFGEGDKELARVLVGTQTGTRRYAMAAGTKRVFEVESTTLDDLPKKVDDVLEAPPPPIPPNDPPVKSESTGTPPPAGESAGTP